MRCLRFFSLSHSNSASDTDEFSVCNAFLSALRLSSGCVRTRILLSFSLNSTSIHAFNIRSQSSVSSFCHCLHFQAATHQRPYWIVVVRFLVMCCSVLADRMARLLVSIFLTGQVVYHLLPVLIPTASRLCESNWMTVWCPSATDSVFRHCGESHSHSREWAVMWTMTNRCE